MRSRGTLYARGALALGLVMVATQAWGTVTQVDGTILPHINDVNNCDGANDDDLQTCFDQYEGVVFPAAGSIDAVVDAAQVPEIFTPNTTINVTFQDIAEGAGFENSFGWYNVGDDVLSAAGRTANLHPILGCGVPMDATGSLTTHKGNPAFYVQNANPDFANQAAATASVNFAMERTAGRYKGGFIGFYLITPEDPNNKGARLPGRINCGDFTEEADGDSLLGRIYFTQRDLNNDGDFVHHLVYSSKTVANRFYFGFEDLFRGGDNDFEDMAIKSVGLTPPCVPQPEICDGIDNDCDTMIDAADPDLTGVNTACQCDDVTLMCDNGPRLGECRTGVTQCTAGAIVCHGTGVSSPETCDLKDNNCNGVVDDNPSGTGAACDGTDGDLCKEGTQQCMNGTIQCSDTTGTSVETCNNMDDDCDTKIDEQVPNGGACGTDTGQCNPGVLVCTNGVPTCTGQTGPATEVCNNLDDDCNGVIDNNPTDVGMACGLTDVGECKKGTTVCSNGALLCAGEVGPSPERCNMLDDDCDGKTDEDVVDDGQPCGVSTGACEPGVFQCVMGALVCTGGTGPTAEQCDAIDNDCDATIDEMVPGVGDMCIPPGGGTGACGMGTNRCINGMVQCVGGASGGTETCNDIDDDCDGMIDEGDLCNGGVCQNGMCASACLDGEFPCPTGKKCEAGFCVNDPCSGVTCGQDMDGNATSCQVQGNTGVCLPICNTITCSGGTVCRGSDGQCVPDTCEYLPKCAADEICVDGACVGDPCENVTCPGDQFCREGNCVKSCEGVQCSAGTVCQDGSCVASGCAANCAVTDQVCNPDTHQCQDSMCADKVCPPTQACNPLTGACEADKCEGVTCPTGQICDQGQCGTPASGEFVTTGGGGGCDAGGSGGGDTSFAVILAIALGGLLMKRRSLALAAGLTAAAAVGAGGCNVNEYCLHCEVGGDGGIPGGDGGMDDGGSGSNDGGPTCDPTQARPETCNLADDDCDGQIDEGINTDEDEMNCGSCGNQCNLPGAISQCVTGSCTFAGCFPGFNDANNDPTDGCEYQCFTSNGGTEACDGLDNDCDNVIDEDLSIPLDSDPNNCGVCGHVCDFFEATGHCTMSMCGFNPTVDCLNGFHDTNGMQADGCEYSCANTNGGVEKCDVIDNDCDGQVDETFNTQTDANNCGQCGNVCAFPHVNNPTCATGMCTFNPATQCAPGFHDADGNPLNGCEYSCTVSNGGVEKCDGVDNDCDGQADEMATGVGAACASTNPANGICTANGTTVCSGGSLVCVGATQPGTETCNNMDDDCDGTKDENVTQTCYTGTVGTAGVGACKSGTQTCAAGVFGMCAGQVTPGTESCNNVDDNCDGRVDNRDAAGNPLQQTCYGGTAGTAGVGTCKSGTQTCNTGSFGACAGEIRPAADVCGDNLDTDCDGKLDAAEGCTANGAEVRNDGEATAGLAHSYDVVLARGGATLGTNIYMVWSEATANGTDVLYRRSTDGGVTYGAVVNVTSGLAAPHAAVKPMLAVDPGANDRIIIAFQTVAADDTRDIRVATSTNGTTFTVDGTTLDTAGDSFHHSVAVTGSTVVVAWEQLDTATLTRDVVSRAFVGGAWVAPIKINTSTGNRFAGRPQVGFSGTNVVWTWREQRAGSTRDIFGAVLPATAAALAVAPATNIRIDGAGTPAMDTRDSDFPVMITSGTNAYLVWQDASTVAGGGSDVIFSRSTTSGASWSAEAIIDDPAAEVSSSFSPSLAIDPKTSGANDDLVAIAWEDRRLGDNVFTSVSQDSGATFGTATRASQTAGAAIAGTTSFPVIAAATSGILVVAYQNQLTNQRPHVFLASSIDSGATWTVNQSKLDTGVGPAIAPAIVAAHPGMKNGSVTAWVDFRTSPNVNGDIYTVLSQ